MPKPVRVDVRMYQVGFGDCFLLSFGYAKPLPDMRSERHILIDFGSTHGAGRGGLLPVAELIHEHTGGHIDVVVVSHRHKDHMSAFGNKRIAGLLAKNGPPSLVVRSWTEDPRVERDAQSGRRRDESAKFVKTLNVARGFVDRLAASMNARGAPGQLKRLVEDQVRNAEAVRQLEEWSKAGNAAYVHYGQKSGIEDIVPGIRVRVLGPPTIEQYPEVRGQRDEDPDEFWMLYKNLLGAGAPILGAEAKRANAGRGSLGPTRWLVERMGRQQANSFLRIVRILDDALNNTSVILLFEVPSAGGMKRLLFAGDAQIENWEYALKEAPDAKANLRALRQVDLYKVGHHGSRNATPRTLFSLWQEPATADRSMIGLMSTMSGVHGDHATTRVPRTTLVNALRHRMDPFVSTEDLGDELFTEFTANLATDGQLTRVL